MQNSALAWIAPLSLGAAVMFALDPDAGRRRRALLRDRTASLTRRSGGAATGFMQDLRNRATGVASRLRGRRDDPHDDRVIEARVRAAIGRVATHPGAIALASVDGIVELNGPVFAREHDEIIRAVQRTAGVLAVIDRMSQHEGAANVPGLQGEVPMRERSNRWSRLAMCTACTAAALLFYAVAHRARAADELS